MLEELRMETYYVIFKNLNKMFLFCFIRFIVGFNQPNIIINIYYSAFDMWKGDKTSSGLKGRETVIIDYNGC